jgi:FTR1 family protein
MFATFVIGLREGLEAALIVGIIAAFLRKQGQRELLRWVFVGVAAAVALCVAVGAVLEVVSKALPQRQQEGLETVIGVLAVGMVTYMVIWMRRHSRELKGQLEGLASSALDGRSGAARAMIAMAFLAVLREGFETAVFLIAAFNESGSGIGAGLGAVLGVAVAVGLGYGIYRGGVRINLSKFFRATGLVLVVVAAGLVVNALHTAHEAGWLNVGQGSTVDLTWLVRPGSVQASLLTGMLGVQPHPTVIEVVGWLLYVIPVGCYVAFPPARAHARRVLLGAGLVAAVAAGAVVLAAPDPKPARAGTGGGHYLALAEGNAHTVKVTITAASGCAPDRVEFAAGGTSFEVRNQDATAVTEVEVLSGGRIIGEKENLPPGFSGRFAIDAGPGTYTLYCPGAVPERIALTASGSARAPSDSDVTVLLKTGARNYAGYVRTQLAALLRSSQALERALRGNDLAAAQDAYAKARPYYELIEPVAESFTIGKDSLDADIDARAGDVPASQWKGFHRIEKGLFQDRKLAGLAAFGTGLVANVAKLQQLTDGLSFHATELANGAQELLDEVAASKITGEEERYSHIDLLDVAKNVEGAQQAFGHLLPAMNKIDAALAKTVGSRFAALDRLVGTYRDSTNAAGYVRYTALSPADKRNLAAAVKAVQEPLSRIASKVANA